VSGLGEWDDDAGSDVSPPAAGRADDVEPQLLDDDSGPELYFKNLDEFVREMIVPTFRRRVGDRSQFHWAADWWRYPEAVVRLEALWRAWEHLRLDPATGMSVWLRDHADHHLGVLFSDYGPFSKSTDVTEHGAPLPYREPPAGLY
jgi:hypothetical protein